MVQNTAAKELSDIFNRAEQVYRTKNSKIQIFFRKDEEPIRSISEFFENINYDEVMGGAVISADVYAVRATGSGPDLFLPVTYKGVLSLENLSGQVEVTYKDNLHERQFSFSMRVRSGKVGKYQHHQFLYPENCTREDIKSSLEAYLNN